MWLQACIQSYPLIDMQCESYHDTDCPLETSGKRLQYFSPYFAAYFLCYCINLTFPFDAYPCSWIFHNGHIIHICRDFWLAVAMWNVCSVCFMFEMKKWFVFGYLFQQLSQENLSWQANKYWISCAPQIDAEDSMPHCFSDICMCQEQAHLDLQRTGK